MLICEKPPLLTFHAHGALPLTAFAGGAGLVVAGAVLEQDAVSVLPLKSVEAALLVVLACVDAFVAGLGHHGVDKVAAAGVGRSVNAGRTSVGKLLKINFLKCSFFSADFPLLSGDAVLAGVHRRNGAVVEGQAELLRGLEGEPVAVGGVLAERETVVRACGVDKVDGEILQIQCFITV